MKEKRRVFNPPPGWPEPPEGWQPPAGWEPDPNWPDLPDGWELWLFDDDDVSISDVDILLSSDNSEASVDTVTDPEYIASASLMELLQAENEALKKQLQKNHSSKNELVNLDDEIILQSVGIYRYHHPLENAAAYKERLTTIEEKVAALLKADTAIEKSNMFTFDNSLSKGRKMTSDLGKLMLRAYNSEVDNSIRSLRAGNVITALKRLEASRNSIAKLGSLMEMRIGDAFHSLRLEEVELTSDWLMKKREEKEIAKEERARLREERRVELELAQERERLDKERGHILNTLAKLKESGSDDPDLQSRLEVLDEAISENDYRLANIRAGYVYIISNRGAFGDNIVKIGLTRRLKPLDRINELSGASVPFRFDIHALYFSEDAVTLENEMHKHFSSRAVNQTNSRKEFFFATPAEIKTVLMSKVGNLLEFTEKAEATEYLQSIKYWPDQNGVAGPDFS